MKNTIDISLVTDYENNHGQPPSCLQNGEWMNTWSIPGDMDPNYVDKGGKDVCDLIIDMDTITVSISMDLIHTHI